MTLRHSIAQVHIKVIENVQWHHDTTEFYGLFPSHLFLIAFELLNSLLRQWNLFILVKLTNFFSIMCPQIRLIKRKIMILWLLFYLEMLNILKKTPFVYWKCSCCLSPFKEQWMNKVRLFSVCLPHFCLPSVNAQFKTIDLAEYNKFLLILIFRELIPKEYFPTFSAFNINSLKRTLM